MVNTGDFGTPARHPLHERYTLLERLHVQAGVAADPYTDVIKLSS